jgi:TorA maturation chaperone TorD
MEVLALQSEDSSLERARQHGYAFFAAFLLNRPTPESLDRLLGEGGLASLHDMFPGDSAVRRLGLLARERRQGSWTDDELLLDFEALFRVPGKSYLHPYESAYVTALEGGGKAMLCAASTRQVARAYASLSLGLAEGFAELPDHLGVELEFMAYLCGQAASSLETNGAADACRYMKLQKDFFREHLARWAFDCLAQMASKAQTPLYRCLASLLDRFLREEQQHLSSSRVLDRPCP